MPSPTSEFLNKHEIVRAGAGAGKTYTLTHKVADLARDFSAEHGRFPRVIVTTFTRKATGELRERLMLLALEEKPDVIDFVNSRSHLVVSTIHGVMDLYLKRYGANLCVDPGYKIIGAPEASKMARQVLRQIVLGDEEFANLLEAYPFNRVVGLVKKLDALRYENPDVVPFELADFEALFQKRAKSLADQLADSTARIREETDLAAWASFAELFDGLAALLVRGKWTTNRPLFIDARTGIRAPAKPRKGDHPLSEETQALIKDVRKSMEDFVEPVYDPSSWSLFATNFEIFQRMAARFHEEFHKVKLAEGLLEISDLEHLAMKCIRHFPETADAFWKEWDYWLIDEYQDTSPFQVELLKHLTGESPNFIVGDPQQSIYLFRGARSEVFGAREKQIESGGGKKRFLKMNRRSAPELLLFMNDVFKRMDPPFEEMDPFFAEGETLDPKKKVATFFIGAASDSKAAAAGVEAERADGSDGTAEVQDDDHVKNEQELRAIVAHVQNLIAAGAKPEEICVLARTNKVLVDVANRLAGAQLPTHVHAASGFYDRRETRDALAFLKFLVNPHDNFNTIELLRSPWFKVPDKTLVAFTKRVESVWENLSANAKRTEDFESVHRLSGLLEKSRELGLSEAFKRGLIDAGFVDLSHFHDVSGRRESNIWKFLTQLQQEEGRAGFNPLAFITSSRVDIKMDEGNSEGDAVAAVEPNRINLMTVHASKGLEFDHVIIPRMDQKPQLTTHEEFTFDEQRGRWAIRVPFGENYEMTKSLAELNWLETFKKSELEEHARVLYVAITRAVESVFLSWTGKPAKDSWAQMIHLDLSLGLHEGEQYSYTVEEGESKGRKISRAAETAVQPRELFKPARESSEQSLSVTEILEKRKGSGSDSGSGAASNQKVTQLLQAASVGSSVHRLMESLKYHAASGLESIVRKWFPGQEEKVLRAIEFVRTNRLPPLLEIIANGEVEWGFAILQQGTLIEGQIDLWGRADNNDVWIIDYKTGNPEGRTKAFEQMAIYAVALRKSGLINAEEKIQLAAVYPFAREVYVEEDTGKGYEVLTRP